MLRDKFAMAAMQAGISGESTDFTFHELAQNAYQIADAMMKERANWDFSGDPDNYAEHEDGYGYQKEREPEKPTGMLVSDTPIRRVAFPPEVPAPPIGETYKG